MSSTSLIRTLSDQHWHNAGLILFSQEFLHEYTAGIQGDWVFKVKKIKGHPTMFNAITYHKDVEISRTKLDIWKYISANPSLSWATYL
jgi:hypothetical protein